MEARNIEIDAKPSQRVTLTQNAMSLLQSLALFFLYVLRLALVYLPLFPYCFPSLSFHSWI
jgi:hypothetical protein